MIGVGSTYKTFTLDPSESSGEPNRIVSVSGLRCARCGDTLRSRATFQFHASGGPIHKCFACALAHGPMLKRSLLIALLVGTILIAINQGDVLLRGQWSAALLWKILLTYVVPFVVATSGALTNSHAAPAD